MSSSQLAVFDQPAKPSTAGIPSLPPMISTGLLSGMVPPPPGSLAVPVGRGQAIAGTVNGLPAALPAGTSRPDSGGAADGSLTNNAQDVELLGEPTPMLDIELLPAPAPAIPSAATADTTAALAAIDGCFADGHWLADLDASLTNVRLGLTPHTEGTAAPCITTENADRASLAAAALLLGGYWAASAKARNDPGRRLPIGRLTVPHVSKVTSR